MLSRLFYLFTLLATAVFVSAQGDDAWHLDYIYVIGNEELDPIVSPNQQASHMHKIIGGSRMAAFYNTDYYSAASCSSCRNQADKSNYWMPNLYVIDHDTDKYVPVPAHVRFYYFLARNSAKQPVTPFPKGLRILTGNPNNKSPTNVAQFTCQVKSDFTNSLLANNFNFARDCPWGMKTELFFPPCWDGVNLYKTDGSHMSYPDNGVRSGACPWSHPVRLPAIQLEYTWATSNYNPGQALAGNLAWANGDTTGYGVHGDFVEGWDQAALGAALNDSRCVNLGYSIAMTNCPAFDQYMDDNAAKNCQFERGQLTETFGNADNVPIPRLPGCNPEWGTDATKPGCSPAIAGLDVSKFTGTDGSYVARAADNKQFKLPTTPGWTNIACLKEVTSITGGVAYTDAKMTVESCTASCLAAGYNYAGMGQVGAWNCVCGTGIRSSASTVPGVCTTPCPGNSAQQCGGSYIFNIWYAPPGTQQNQTTLADGSHYVGCYNNPSTASNGLIGAATYSFQSNSMTTEVCLQACHNMKTNWALTTSAKWCYCGNDWKFGSGALVPASYCTVPCTGNSSQACGDYYRSSVYNITDADIEHSSVYHPAGWQGCYQDLSGRVGLTNNSWTSTAATPQMCIDGCSELGYKYAGVENGKQCFCGNVPQTTTRLPVSQCNTPCAGNSTGVCGGPSAMDLYTTTNAKVTVQSKAATKPEGYLGCFLDAGSNIAFPNYYSYNFAQMTVEVCKQSCLELGYSYAGVENGNQCRCGNTAPQTAQYVQSLTCTKNCTGNAAQTCGAGGYLEAYALSNATLSPVMPGSSSAAYVGCYENSNRGLTAYTYYDNTITVEKCRTTCSEFGYSLASVYLSKYCGCGNSWVGAAQKYASSYCQYYKCGGNSTEYCGGQTTAALYNTSDVTVTINKPDGWVGCWTDNSNSRTLQGYAYNASPMSSKACRIACANQGFAYAGTEFGSQCFCGNEIANGAKAPTSSCSTKCNGYANETCGGGGFMDLYNATGAVANNGVQGYLGCFTDDSSLNGASYTSDYMSIDTCNQWCFARSFAYAGVRNGNQCKCGNTSPSLATTTASCVNACSANSKQNCGTASTIATYDLAKTGIKSGDFVATSNSTGYVGCYSEGSTRMLPSYYFSQSGMTNDICISNCKALGYDLAGTEFGTQCYCADKLDATSGGYRRQETACSMACGGKDGICGNANVLSVWSTANATSAVRVLEGYKGCFAVGTFGNAAPLTYTTGTITTELCRRTCKNAGYSIAGLTNGNTCTCGNNPTYGATVAPVSCNAPCQGNTTQTCGGQFSKAWSIYDTTGAGAGVPAGYPANYVGCVVDGSPRVLPNYYINNGGMSSDACRKICVGAGYSNYGTEAGTQCFCGANKLAVPIIPDSQCNTKCPGAPTEMCGGGGRLSYYRVDNTTSLTPSASASVSASASASASASKSASSSAVVSSSSSKAASSSSAASSSASKAASSSSAAAVSSTSKAASSSAAAASSSTSKAASSSAAAVSSSASKASSAAASSSSSKAASVSTSRIGGGAIATDGTAVETQSATEPVTASSTSAVQSSVTAPVTSSSTQAAASSAAPASSSSESPAPASSSAAASSSTSSDAASSSAAASSSTTTQAAPSSAAASSSTTSSAPAPSGTALGCYKGSNTAFSSSIMVGHDNLTPAMCQIWCNANYYTYAGVSGGTTCGCSNTLTGLTSTAAADCSIPCSGNPQINCGGTGNSTYGVFQAQAAVRPAKRFDSNSESIRRPRNERDTQRRIVHAPRADANSKRRRGGLFSKW